jgi:deoxyribodipyrimidine photolyase
MGVRVTKITGSSSDDWIYYTSVTVYLNYNQYSAIADLHTIQFTVSHELGFSVFSSRLLAADLNTETSTSNNYEVFLPFLVQLPWYLGTQLKSPPGLSLAKVKLKLNLCYE